MFGGFSLVRNRHCFRAVCLELLQPWLLPPVVLSHIFSYCTVLSSLGLQGLAEGALWLFGSADRWILIDVENSQVMKLRVWTLAKMGSHVLNAFCFWDSRVAEFHPITNTLKMGLPTPLANGSAQSFSVCLFQLTHFMYWSQKVEQDKRQFVPLVLLREHCCILIMYVAFHIWSLSVLATIFAVIFIRLANVCLFSFCEVSIWYLGPKCIVTLL